MPDVIFDPRFQQYQAGTSAYIGASGPFSNNASRGILIYTAGTVPTDMNELAVWNDIPGGYIPSANLLIHWASWNGSLVYIDPTLTVAPDLGQVTVTTDAALAVASGTAAEFIYYQMSGSTAAAPTRTTLVQSAISGSVSLTGGGGDLVIDNLSIVSGSSYSVALWRHKIYQNFTY